MERCSAFQDPEVLQSRLKEYAHLRKAEPHMPLLMQGTLSTSPIIYLSVITDPIWLDP